MPRRKKVEKPAQKEPIKKEPIKKEPVVTAPKPVKKSFFAPKTTVEYTCPSCKFTSTVVAVDYITDVANCVICNCRMSKKITRK